MCQKRNELTNSPHKFYIAALNFQNLLTVLVQSIRAKIQDSPHFNHLLQIQAQKLDQLIGLQITSDSSPESHKNVVVPWPRETCFHYRYYISLYCHSQWRKFSWPSNIFSINALLRNGPKPELYGRYYYCIAATSSSRMDRMELTQFITAVNSFHLALKYTWEISYTFLAFLDIKI